MIQQLDVDKHGRSISQLFRDGVQERFWTEDILAGPGFTPLRPQGGDTKLEDVRPLVVLHRVSS